MKPKNTIEALDRLIQRIDSSSDATIEPIFRLEIFVLKHGYVLKYHTGRSVYTISYEPENEAIERESTLMKRIASIIAEKRGLKTEME